MSKNNTNYLIEDYHKKSLFSSFLPGISGEKGIPLWCLYMNRGQAISSFGVQDKNHSIMEFYPAHQAYERTDLLGFRTFLKIDGNYTEAFLNSENKHNMIVGMNSLSITEEAEGYTINVEYETLPLEPLAGLMRSVTITNTSEKALTLEILDGMAEILPYGVSASLMKDMGQTAKAWMQVIDSEKGTPRFKVRASLEDSAVVTEVKGFHFAVGRERGGKTLPAVADREIVFSFDSALKSAYGFKQCDIEKLLKEKQVNCNDVPCCFFGMKKELQPSESLCIEEIYGMSENMEDYKKLINEFRQKDWFLQKQELAKDFTFEITNRIGTKTANPIFDGYCRQSYLDNLLRGGYPVILGKNHIFYLYSRKHGDMERDYNFFSMLPEAYSQGNGNFRDVNQNRRCDVLFSPFVGDSVIKKFYNALQINGYNPLAIEKTTYHFSIQDGDKRNEIVSKEKFKQLSEVLENDFTPGMLYEKLLKWNDSKEKVEEVFEYIMNQSYSIDNTAFLEGYWCDHWTYNLDLIESYLSVFPENKKHLFYEDNTYLFTQAHKRILPRVNRYEKTEKGIRQYYFLKDNVDTSIKENHYLKDKKGMRIETNLVSKLFALLSVKISALDPYGMGLEMEGGKPGWYDALNGLPGLLGSSMAETYELYRMVIYLQNVVVSVSEKISVFTEVAQLTEELLKACEKWKEEIEQDGEVYQFWNEINKAKEKFWDNTSKCMEGTVKVWSSKEQMEILSAFGKVLKRAKEKAEKINGSICPTYFYYEITEYEETSEGILPKSFKVKQTPDFLEGSVHALKLDISADKKKQIYDNVKNSHLYDEQLKMYKVNASLSKASFELGRACAFTSGWLENESVWLHMEYKYLLELLKSEMYEEFMTDFYNAAVPFLKEETYGRSLLENSSFIASSVNPNEKIQGKGFVARLSGSTAEFLQIWQIMMFGKNPFFMGENGLNLQFKPCIPEYLLGDEGRVEAIFLGNTLVSYEVKKLKALIPGFYFTNSYFIEFYTGECCKLEEINGEIAEKIRDGEVSKIIVEIKSY